MRDNVFELASESVAGHDFIVVVVYQDVADGPYGLAVGVVQVLDIVQGVGEVRIPVRRGEVYAGDQTLLSKSYDLGSSFDVVANAPSVFLN